MSQKAERAATVASIALTVLLVGYVEAPTNGGTVRGSVRLIGTAPRLAPHRVTERTQLDACTTSVVNDQLALGAGGALANAVVWIEGITAGAPARRVELSLDQRGCRYLPRVQAAVVGSRLTVMSSDATLHNVHAHRDRRTLFNLAMPAKGMRVRRRLSRLGIVELTCDAGHPWMSAWIHVFDHPYFAVTGPDGRFEMPDVPAGVHTVHVWHERYPEQTRRVTVAAGGVAIWDVSLR